MNYTVFYSLLLGYAFVALFLGRQSASKIQTEEDYFLGGRKVGFFGLTMTLVATQFGGGAIVGGAEAAYQYGWLGVSYSFGIALGFIILALGMGGRLRALNVRTVPEIFEKVYKSDFLRQYAAIIYIIAMFFILVASCVATRKFFYGIGFTNDLFFLAFWAIIILHTMFGGLPTVVKMDIIQMTLTLSVFALVYLWMGDEAVSSVKATSFEQNSDIPWLNWVLMPCLFTVIGQDMGQRCFSAQSPKTVAKAMILAAFLQVVASLLPAFLGIYAAKNGIGSQNSSVLVEVVQQLTSPLIASFFACAVLLAILSTADSLLCAVSSNVSFDIPLITRLQTRFGLLVTRLTTFVIGFSAVILSYYANEIIPIMIQAYSLTICIFFVPIVVALFSKSPSKKAALVASLVGTVAFFGLSLFPDISYKELICIGLSFVAYLVVSKTRF